MVTTEIIYTENLHLDIKTICIRISMNWRLQKVPLATKES